MGELTAQLARRLPEGTVRLHTPVRGIDRAGDGPRVLHDGGAIAANAVIIAIDAPALAGLTMAGAPAGVDVAPARGTAAIHLDAPRSPTRGRRDLHLGAPGEGPIATLATMSDVAPTYAPSGHHLVTVSTVGVPELDDAALVAAVRAQARAWFGDEVDAWRTLAVQRIAYAQPRQDPVDLPTLARPVAHLPGVWLCGDHRDTGSIQGAMVSGRRAAEALLAA
jgi:predicted NAD/FAD-dependent oxidoreductase